MGLKGPGIENVHSAEKGVRFKGTQAEYAGTQVGFSIRSTFVKIDGVILEKDANF